MTTASTNDPIQVRPANILSPGAKVKNDANDMAEQKDMFLKLMVAQLQNQDPSSPMDQKDMMAQMAQFTQVEQSANMVKAIETLTFNSTVAQSVNLIGKNVSYAVDTAIESQIKTAKVLGVTTTGGVVQLQLEDGSTVEPSSVVRVTA